MNIFIKTVVVVVDRFNRVKLIKLLCHLDVATRRMYSIQVNSLCHLDFALLISMWLVAICVATQEQVVASKLAQHILG